MFLLVLHHRYFHLCSIQNSWNSSVTNRDMIMKSWGTFDRNAKSQTLFCVFLSAADERFIGLLPEAQSCASLFVIKTTREEGQRASQLLRVSWFAHYAITENVGAAASPSPKSNLTSLCSNGTKTGRGREVLCLSAEGELRSVGIEMQWQSWKVGICRVLACPCRLSGPLL